MDSDSWRVQEYDMETSAARTSCLEEITELVSQTSDSVGSTEWMTS